jgi:hypothetical protein
MGVSRRCTSFHVMVPQLLTFLQGMRAIMGHPTNRNKRNKGMRAIMDQ